MAPRGAWFLARSDLLGGGVLGDSLGSFRHSVLGQFSGQEKPDSSLDFPRGDGCPLVVEGKTGSFSSDALEDVIDEGVHDGHGLAGNTGVGVDLLQHLVDVDGVGFTPLLALLFVALGDGLLGLTGLLGSFSGSFGRHFYGYEKNGKTPIGSECYITRVGLHLASHFSEGQVAIG